MGAGGADVLDSGQTAGDADAHAPVGRATTVGVMVDALEPDRRPTDGGRPAWPSPRRPGRPAVPAERWAEAARAGFERGGAVPGLPPGGVVVATSGSTGSPKSVLLSAAALRAAAEAAHSWLGGAGWWLSALPAGYVAGLMTLVRARQGGTGWSGVASDLRDLDDALEALVGRQPLRPRRSPAAATSLPAYVSIVPTQLAGAVDRPSVVRALARCDAVLVGGSGLDPGLWRRATALGVPVVRTYGMSETCGGVVYEGEPLPGVTVGFEPAGGLTAAAGFAPDGASDGASAGRAGAAPTVVSDGASRRVAADGASGRVAADGAAPAAEAGEASDHRITLTTPTAFSGYVGDPAASAAALRGRTVLTADLGHLERGRLVVTGRIDEVVQSGGVNVDLADLQRQLDSVFGFGAIVAFAVPDPVWGSRMMAAATRSYGLAEIVGRLGGRVTVAARPRGVLVVPELPLTESGKPDRRRLAQLWEARHGNRP